MRYASAILFATAALAVKYTPARQYIREASPDGLVPRQANDPEEICGTDFTDCSDSAGWCCPSEATCSVVEGLPLCEFTDDSIGLTAEVPAFPYADLQSGIEVISSAIGSFSVPDLPATDDSPITGTDEPLPTGVEESFSNIFGSATSTPTGEDSAVPSDTSSAAGPTRSITRTVGSPPSGTASEDGDTTVVVTEAPEDTATSTGAAGRVRALPKGLVAADGVGVGAVLGAAGALMAGAAVMFQW